MLVGMIIIATSRWPQWPTIWSTSIESTFYAHSVFILHNVFTWFVVSWACNVNINGAIEFVSVQRQRPDNVSQKCAGSRGSRRGAGVKASWKTIWIMLCTTMQPARKCHPCSNAHTSVYWHSHNLVCERMCEPEGGCNSPSWMRLAYILILKVSITFS